MQHQKLSPPTSLFCVAAPSDATLLAQWETHLLPLMQTGQITVWSERYLMAGASRTQQLHEHLDQAQVIVFLLSPDFFASDECMTLVEQALSGLARVIPLLVRPSGWHQSRLASLQCLPPNSVPVISWDRPEEAFHMCYQEFLRILGQSRPTPSPAIPQQAGISTLQNRGHMLRRLRRTYSDLMSQSLQGTVWLELSIASKPDAVQNAANFLLRMKSSTEQCLPPGTSIMEVYDEVEHELLILGEPGTGKSMLLLDLAQKLVERAEQDETHPLPMILPLSSWAVKRSPLQDWIAEQLAHIYSIPPQLSMQWARERDILPLLDGLDQMEETSRPACIAAINTYHRHYLAPLVVCSRTTEYEVATEHHRLALQGAIVVQPLIYQHIDAYLAQAGKPLAALRSALKKNRALHPLVTTPLLLNTALKGNFGHAEESHIIAIIGDTGSGKSHYIASCIHQLTQRSTLARIGCVRIVGLGNTDKNYRDTYYTPVYVQHEEMKATKRANTYASEPLIYEITFHKKLRLKSPRAVNLIFYDSSGEDLIDQKRMLEYSSYIFNASALIFLADPLAMPHVVAALPPHLRPAVVRPDSTANVLNRIMRTLEMQWGIAPGMQLSIPVAITVSKSDLIKFALKRNSSPLFLRDSAYTSMLDTHEFEHINAEIRDFLQGIGDRVLVHSSLLFKNTSFFAVSATGWPPDHQNKYPCIEPRRVLDPLLWALWKLRLINDE